MSEHTRRTFLGLAAATLSFHLAHLSRAKLVRSRQQGRFIYYSADFDSMNDVIGFLTTNCCVASECGPAECRPSMQTAARKRMTPARATKRRSAQ